MTEQAADPRKLRQQIANAIAVSIRDGPYVLGQRLPSERDLAEDYKVSRPTIREAMIILEARGLVEARHGAGVYVADAPRPEVSAPELEVSAFELVEARRLIEGDACALAAAVLTDEQVEELTAILHDMAEEHDFGALADLADRRFHVAIAKATGNSVLVAMVENLWDLRYKPSSRDMLERAGRVRARPLVDDHQDILDALKARDPVAARAAMREHLGRVIDNLLTVVETDAIEEARLQMETRRNEVARRARV
ncbi:transcriptional regulator [Caulobacter sp. AP07]|uniref:FadR/GntR family transcriptional regulator n=1 Tax=Caulobacter sp. AP07 TaxID=1144304 RepID=UPI0002722094|nr:FadR/GntR family transcriptional regulator [Caulobacter sp. AP07]EJL27190.1 transcriptional regulator [Caulobacter sp. AP07]